jgi:hypothetical protein
MWAAFRDELVKLAEQKPYTKPALRARIKSQVMAGSDGGRPGQWSARKAQLVAQKYESSGGGYKGRKTQAQKSLKKWTKEDWTTSDGSGNADTGKGMKRYLPRTAWQSMSSGERAATNSKKLKGDARGQQFVANTGTAQAARRRAKIAKLLKDPAGGLTAAGRKHFEQKGESRNLRPGVKKPESQMSVQDMKRKGSWARRFYGQSPLPPLKKPNGEPTRLALTARAWGEPVPQNEQQARAIAAKGTRLLERAKGAAVDRPVFRSFAKVIEDRLEEDDEKMDSPLNPSRISDYAERRQEKLKATERVSPKRQGRTTDPRVRDVY